MASNVNNGSLVPPSGPQFGPPRPPTSTTGDNEQSFHETAVYATCRDQMTKDQKNALSFLTKSLNMDKEQFEAWNLTFFEVCYASFIQGPPGSGKTRLVGSQGIGLALCGVKTLITAPSKIATREIMSKLINMMDKVAEVFPQVRDWFDIVYLPDRGVTGDDMKKDLVDWNDLAYWMISEGENQTGNSNVDDYALWKHIVRTMKEDKDNGADLEKQNRGKRWLDTLVKVKACQHVKIRDTKHFCKTSEAVVTEIFSSSTSKVKIMVCTCNTAGCLDEYGYKPQVCIGDEAASGNEANQLIPLSLMSISKLIHVGDQMQLQPVVKSHGQSEYSKQYSLSIFARFLNHHSSRTTNLRVNYRMPKEIADFPGTAVYEYLPAHSCTLEESDTYKYIRQWWNSNSAESYREARRAPEYGRPKDLQIRRLFINVKGGKSAHKQGGASKRNFANINAISDFLMNLFSHEPANQIPKIDLDKITVLSPYKEEVIMLSTHIQTSLGSKYRGLKRFPRFRIIDDLQGGQNELVLLSITPADQHNGSLIGFLSDWHHMNVGLTRAQSNLVIFGNLDIWRSQLSALTSTCKNFGFMIIDLLDRGDIIDVDGLNALPKNKAERLAGPDAYTVEIEKSPANASRLSYRLQQLVDGYNKEEYEKLLLVEWQAKRDKAIEYQKKDKVGVAFD